MMLRFGVYAFIPNQYAFLAISIVHCIGVAIATVASLTYIRNSVDPAVLGTAITLLNATLSIGKAIYGYIFGVVYEIWGSFITVSYTHLDVYKRQLHNRPNSSLEL